MGGLLSGKPVRAFIEQREPLVPHPKFIKLLKGLLPFNVGDFNLSQAPPLDRLTPEEAIDVVAHTTWAMGLAEGVCGPSYVGHRPGTPEYDTCVYNVSHHVAAGTLGASWTPSAPSAPKARRGK